MGGILAAGALYIFAWKRIRSKGRILRKIITAFIPAIIATLITLLFLAALTEVSGWLLVPPLATGLMILVFRELMTVRTEKGNDVLNEADGLAMYMGTAERHRLEMFNPPEETPEVFERLLPYAFALDTAETWANRFEEILRQQQYQPGWYSGPSAANFYTGGAVASLASSMSSTIASASQAPGSSSGSGGGARPEAAAAAAGRRLVRVVIPRQAPSPKGEDLGFTSFRVNPEILRPKNRPQDDSLVYHPERSGLSS